MSPGTVLFVSPILLGALTLVTMIWAFSYGHRVRLRALAQLAQLADSTAQSFLKKIWAGDQNGTVLIWRHA
jgi:hypothetical protein